MAGKLTALRCRANAGELRMRGGPSDFSITAYNFVGIAAMIDF
jgi:hypothetical protein